MSGFKPQKSKPEKDVYSIRLDIDLVKHVDELAARLGLSRNALLTQCIIYAMDHLDEEYKKNWCPVIFSLINILLIKYVWFDSYLTVYVFFNFLPAIASNKYFGVMAWFVSPFFAQALLFIIL